MAALQSLSVHHLDLHIVSNLQGVNVSVSMARHETLCLSWDKKGNKDDNAAKIPEHLMGWGLWDSRVWFILAEGIFSKQQRQVEIRVP